MPQLKTYSHLELPPALKWQVISFMRVEWPFVFTGDNLFGKETYPPASPSFHFVVVEGEWLISHAEIVRQQLEYAGEIYQSYRLGNVFTYPSLRREGYGKQVVEAATHYILNSEVDLALLFCQVELKLFYGGCGWEAFEDVETGPGTPEQDQLNEALRMMLFVSGKGQRGRLTFLQQPL